MSSYNAPFEIHVHGDVVLRADVTFEQLQEALKPLWKYAGARSLADGAASAYEDEPGIEFDGKDHVLQGVDHAIGWMIQLDEAGSRMTYALTSNEKILTGSGTCKKPG